MGKSCSVMTLTASRITLFGAYAFTNRDGHPTLDPTVQDQGYAILSFARHTPAEYPYVAPAPIIVHKCISHTGTMGYEPKNLLLVQPYRVKPDNKPV
jgi:hypothetical protein